MSERRSVNQHDSQAPQGQEERSASLAYIGTDRQVFVHKFPSGETRQLTWSWHEQQGQHNPRERYRLSVPRAPQEQTGSQTTQQSKVQGWTYSWPTWSPVGEQLACFAWHGKDSSASVHTVSADGVESWERANLEQGSPIYGNWSPEADVFTVLVQRGERQLSLEAVVMAQPGKTTRLLTGIPLFWSWAPQGQLMAVHVGGNGDAGGGRILLIEASTRDIVQEISTTPGAFRVPAWSPDGDLLTYVERNSAGVQTLRLFDVQSGESAPVTKTNGMATALWSRDGHALAFGSTQLQGSLLFPSLHVLDLTSGQSSIILDTPVAGFLWAPQGTRLLYLSVDTQHSQLRWHQYDCKTRESVELVRFLPSREQRLQFSFFDQYTGSHPLLDPDGLRLAFTGHLIEPDLPSSASSPTVYTLPLTPPFTPQAIAPGTFACWDRTARD